MKRTINKSATIWGATAAATIFALAAPVFAQDTNPGQTAPGQAPAPTGPGGSPPSSTPTSPTVPTVPGSNPANPIPAPGQNPSTNPTASGNRDTTANDSPDFDLDRAVRASLGSSTDLGNIQRLLRGDKARAGIAASEGRPNVTATAVATRFDQATIINIAGGPPVYALHDNREQLTLGVSQRIDLTGQIRAATGQAKLQTLADQFTGDRIAQQRALLAKTDYYNYLRALHQVQVAQAALRAAQSQRDIAKRLFEGGIGQKIDYLRAETNVASAEQDVTRAGNNADIARATFNDLVGRPLSAPVNAKDVEGVTVGTDAGATAGAVGTSTFTPFPSPTGDVDVINPDDAIALAQQRRPEILQNAVLVRVAETGVKLARAGSEPGLTLSAGGNYYPTTSFADVRQRTAQITASLSIPLYDGGATRDRVTEARTRVETAQANLESSKSDAALSVRQAYLNLSTAARQISAANAALQQAIAARQLAQVRYEGQVGLFLEVTDAQAALVRAENAQVDAVYDYLVARARFENATGTPVQY